MQTEERPFWAWEKTDVRHSGSSGDIAKLFKNEGIAHPGVMARGAPPDEATLAAREIIQNSWDAARELQDELVREGVEAPPFVIDFCFEDHEGPSKSALASALDLEGLKSQLSRVTALGAGARGAIGLRSSICLDTLDDPGVPIRTLIIVEHGATGMYGTFDQARSKLYLALISIGYTRKAEGAGGSYGYGKAGLVGASSTRTVVAYTCFRERADDPGVTRRLIGMTYWGQHEIDSSSFTGFARFGRFADGWSQPFENEAADEVARSLGIETRDPTDLNDLGTTFLLIDPLIAPDDLRIAIERNWWPAITDNAFTTHVSHRSGSGERTYEVRPLQDPILKTFIRGYELATTAQDNALTHEVSKSLGRSSTESGELPLGRIGLVAKLDGWSYAEYEDETDESSTLEDQGDEDAAPAGEPTKHSSLVALVRGPRMVVEYFEHAIGKPPFIRGTFVADDAVDDLLRQTEPKAHDAWQVRGAEEGIDERAPEVAGTITKRIKRNVVDFQKKLKPPPPAPGDIRLPIFADLFQKLMTGKGVSPPKPPPTAERDINVHFVKQGLKEGPGDTVVFEATVSFRLADNFTQAESTEVLISLDYSFLEDGKKGRTCPSTIVAPSGFVAGADGNFTGVLTRSSVEFSITTIEYSPDWSGRITASGRIKPKQGGGTDGS